MRKTHPRIVLLFLKTFSNVVQFIISHMDIVVLPQRFYLQQCMIIDN